MARMFLFILVVCLGCGFGFGFLTNTEEKITVALMNKLEIRHWILVEDSNFSLRDLNRFKNLLKWKRPVTYQTTSQLYQYFLKESFPNINTLVVFKVPKIRIIANFLNLLENVEKNDYLYKFKWIVFVKNPLPISIQNELLVPYNCLFIIVQQEDDDRYSLKEIYKVKNRMFLKYYGSWSKDLGLSTTNLSMYIRRRDLNNSKLIMEYYGEKETCTTPRQCGHLEVLNDYAKLMNFRFRWVEPDSLLNNEEWDVVNMALAYSPEFLDNSLDYLAPLFQIKINWYIRRPRFLEQADFFIQPFEDEIWLSIFMCLIIYTAMSAILHYCHNHKRQRPKLIDYLFLAFESICNQDGYPKKVTNPHRIACFTIRFFALFMVPAYSGTIISYLAVREPQMPFKGLRGFVKNGKYSIGACTNCFSHQYFQQSRGSLMRYINNNFFTNVEASEVMDKLCDEPFAFVELDNDIYNLEPKCPIFRMRRPLAFIFSATPLRKNSPFTRVFNHNFIRYYSSGIQEKMQKIMTRDQMIISKSKLFRTVSLKQMRYVFSIIPIGIILATTFIVCEIISKFLWEKFKTFKSRRCYKSWTRDLEGFK